MESEHIIIQDVREHYERLDSILEDYIIRTDLKGKKNMHFSLLAEEAVRLAKAIINDQNTIEIWFEGDNRLSEIFIKTTGKLNDVQQDELISMSSSGENDIKETFFDIIKSKFTGERETSWSLADYEAELRLKKEQDKLSIEAWDNLERSLLANLATDISIEVSDKGALMIIAKDFSKTATTVASRKPVMTTTNLIFTNKEDSIKNTIEKADDVIKTLDLGKKDALHVKLAYEESIGMVNNLSGDFAASIWTEKYKDNCALKLKIYTKMDLNKKEEFIATSTSKKNAEAVGFMAKVKDVVETGIYNYENIMKLNQKYNGYAINYGAMGTYINPTVSENSALATGLVWSMMDYKNELRGLVGDLETEEQSEPWDELERSIIANIADDVVVGVKKNIVNMSIVIDMKEAQ